MIEILFRGKRILDGKWVFGLLLKEWDGSFYIVTEEGKIKPNGTPALKGHDVEQGTIAQFTGAVDRNKVKIFEHDIIKQKIFLHDEHGNYRGVGEKYLVVDKLVFADIMKFGLTEDVYWLGDVVGNIHDNPELLEMGK